MHPVSSGGFNTRAYKECRNCFLDKNKGERKAKKAGKTAAALMGNSSFESMSSSYGSSPPHPASRISSATHTWTNATLRGHRGIPGDHPCIGVVFTLPTPAGFVVGAIADSGAQLTIIPESHLCAGRIDLCKVQTREVELSAANGAKINATSSSSEQFRTTSKVYVVSNVDECYLSCDVRRGLKIIDANFQEAGGMNLNQHGNNKLGWDRTRTVIECSPFSSYQLHMDRSGCMVKRTRQHLWELDPLDVAPAAPAPRRPQEQRPHLKPIQLPPEEAAHKALVINPSII